jgi:aspartate kinase
MRSSAGVSSTFFNALHEAGINVDMISTSEIRISIVTHADRLAAAVKAVHEAFGLDGTETATVYGGTGR